MRTNLLSSAILFGMLACGTESASATVARDLGEYFDVQRLHYVGLETGRFGTYAYLQPDCGHRFSVQVGLHVGMNHGKVFRITADAVDILELVTDGQGGFIERPRKLVRERLESARPAPFRYLAYEKNSIGDNAWVESGGCPRMHVQVQDVVGDDDERVEAISPTEIRLGKCVIKKDGSCEWVRRTAAIEKSP